MAVLRNRLAKLFDDCLDAPSSTEGETSSILAPSSQETMKRPLPRFDLKNAAFGGVKSITPTMQRIRLSCASGIAISAAIDPVGLFRMRVLNTAKLATQRSILIDRPKFKVFIYDTGFKVVALEVSRDSHEPENRPGDAG